MKLFVLTLVLGLSAGAYAADEKPAGKAKSAAELEKEKAMANPYANDLGPKTLDEVKSYPAKYQEGYKLLVDRCAQCHEPSRPLNSQFVETSGADMKAREAALAGLKKSKPELFKDKNVWQIEADIWQRYVKRMMSKPGCGVEAGGKMTKDESKKIWEFLVFDSNERKLKNPAKWEAHRKKLLEDFKAKYPKRYEELYAGGSK